MGQQMEKTLLSSLPGTLGCWRWCAHPPPQQLGRDSQADWRLAATPVLPSVWLARAFSLSGGGHSPSHTRAGISQRTDFPQHYSRLCCTGGLILGGQWHLCIFVYFPGSWKPCIFLYEPSGDDGEDTHAGFPLTQGLSICHVPFTRGATSLGLLNTV